MHRLAHRSGQDRFIHFPWQADLAVSGNPDAALAGQHGYDSLHLAAKAITDAGSDKPQALRDALEKVKDFPGIGGIFTFTPEDHGRRLCGL